MIPLLPDDTWNGYPGVVHGGIIAAIMDDSMAWSVFKTAGKWGVTAKMTLRYRRSMKTVSEYTVRGRVTKVTGKRYSTESSIIDEDGNIIAESSGLFIVSENMNEEGVL